jgi:hypothetical protein
VRRVACRRSWMPALLASLLLVAPVLVNELGSPAILLRTLADLDDTRTEPVAAVLPLLGLLAEVLAGYVLVVLALGSACMLPGAMGRRAGRLVSLVTPVGARRLLDLLVGGTLLAQATLAVPPSTPSGDRRGGPQLIATATIPQLSRSDAGHLGAERCHGGGRWTSRNRSKCGPPPPRPVSGATAALAGGGPSTPAPGHISTPAPGYVVVEGDTLWDIAVARLAPADRSAGRIQRYWRQIYRANRAAIGADPCDDHP